MKKLLLTSTILLGIIITVSAQERRSSAKGSKAQSGIMAKKTSSTPEAVILDKKLKRKASSRTSVVLKADTDPRSEARKVKN